MRCVFAVCLICFDVLQGRDLRIMDPSLATSYPSAILCREKALVVSLEHIKVGPGAVASSYLSGVVVHWFSIHVLGRIRCRVKALVISLEHIKVGPAALLTLCLQYLWTVQLLLVLLVVVVLCVDVKCLVSSCAVRRRWLLTWSTSRSMLVLLIECCGPSFLIISHAWCHPMHREGAGRQAGAHQVNSCTVCRVDHAPLFAA
jgi:hypothetical protein